MKRMSRLLAMLLCIVMLAGMLPAGVMSVQAAGETTYVLAGSDFQADAGDAAGVQVVNGLIDAIKDAGYDTMDGFLFAGDYSIDATKTSNINALKNAIKTAYPDLTDSQMVLIQGNHDDSARYGGAEGGLVGSILNKSGANDAEDYGVFVINEQDYMWRNDNEATVKQTAANLKTYLDGKRNAGYTKPIFVISHLPLNYNMRTKNDGDGKYANYIFDVLNEAGEAGLNIIFLFGHDHSNGWDDYLGGAAIYLEKGDEILIAQASQSVFEVETLNFTYMNAGYVGYYRNVNSGAETDLSMTVFEITDDAVTIKRFAQSGMHDLKSAGVRNSYKNENDYDPNAEVYNSPQKITLNKTITPAGEEIEPPNSGNTGSGATERTYTRVTNTSELVSGDKYLIIHNGQNDFMIPSVTSDGGTRIGYDLVSGPTGLGNDQIYGEYQEYEWTFETTGGGWKIGSDGGYMTLQAADSRVAAQLTANGDTMVIGGSANNFTFTSATYSNGNYVLNYNSTGDLINGYASGAAPFYIYRMTAEASSGGNVDTEGGDWITITDPTSGQKIYIYTQANSIIAGEAYVIVAKNDEIALQGATSMGPQTVEIDGATMTSTVELTEWTFSGNSNGTNIVSMSIYNGSRYLRYSNNSFNLNDFRANLYVSDQGNTFRIQNDTSSIRYLYYNGSSWTRSGKNSAQEVRLFKLTDTTTTEGTAGLYGKISGELTYNVEIGTSAEAALAAVKAGVDILYHTGDAGAAQTFPDDGEGMTWTLDPSYDGVTPGEYAVTIAYNRKTLGVAKVVVPSVKITGYTVEPAEGTVNKGASQAAKTGALVYVQLENGMYYTVPVTVNMLTHADGTTVSTGVMDTIKNLTLTYNGVKITENFTLNVVAATGNNYPEYPNEGAVKVNKTATGVDFQSSGIAQVEVSASGVPVKKGADVIVMLDLSSSMNNTVDGATRLSVLEASLQAMMTQLKANGEDGQPMDIRIAVADFHRYYPDSSSPYYINSADHLKNGSIRTNAEGTNKVYTNITAANPNGKLDATAFVSVHDLAINEFDGLATKSGTNYDYAFDAVYQLGEAITAQNALDGEDRDLFVIFMSDGAPFQYNYFSAQSGNDSGSTDARYWNNWLQGTMTDTMFDSNARNDYYNPDGKHWMAEAIKGDPALTYPVIRKNNESDADGDTWVNVNGLGAKMYSIGFCLAVDKEITVASMDAVIRNIASSEQYYFRADTADDLNNAFTQIGRDIAYAAYNARFVDQMGDDFNLQLAVSKYTVVENGVSTEQTLAPVIEILTYDIYTKAEADAGQIPTGKNIGDRKGTSTLKEVVKFSNDGTKAYSNLIDVDKDGICGVTVNADGSYTISDADDNILGADGIIYATTFLYNSNPTAVTVNGVNIPTGKNAGGLTTGSTTELPSETFYWNMGTVQTSELAMRYYVYLEGSMEGTRDAGSYSTNEFATLYYDNYLGNPCYKETVSPVIAWKEANVSYAFYLVNEKGEIIVNQTTGQTGSFANKVAVTNPVVYKTVLLNNEGTVEALKVADVENQILPLGYELYDRGAEYEVKINSNSTGYWKITATEDVATTYVTQFDPDDASAYSNELLNGIDGNDVTIVTGNDYTHTVVWFAVLWEVQALPDTVVVDYGLPVDISVLTNDMFGENGRLAGIGSVETDGVTLDGFTALNVLTDTVYTGEYGVAEADLATGEVRYTLNTMQMDSYDKFAYAVNYTGAANSGYYYDTVTVIPATTIYYEDNFLTYAASGTVWEDAGNVIQGATQDEDRPGQYSLTDANNIYGYDSVNNGMATYSLGSAKKVHVGEGSYATASFTFMGTGFDVLSMTSNTTGTITVKVTDAKGEKVEAKAVNTYYGYTKNEDGSWTATPDTAAALYQVPVMQVNGLAYGQYTVTITATWAAALDKTTADGYDLYLDAIRIYDPANNGAQDNDTVIEDAYKADGEGWPTYVELRNQLLAAGSFDANDKLNGAMFIDGVASLGDANIRDYESYGPNNEVYLAPGQSVAFLLELPANVANVHIGLSSADGAKVTYTITNIAQATDSETGVTAGDYYNAKTYELNTATDMYYNLTSWKKDIIVITNTGNQYNTVGVLAISNIKFTYTENPNAASAVDELDEPVLYVTRSAAMLTLRRMNTSDPVEDTVGDTNMPETDVTEPEVDATKPESGNTGTTTGDNTNTEVEDTVTGETNAPEVDNTVTEGNGADDTTTNEPAEDIPVEEIPEEDTPAEEEPTEQPAVQLSFWARLWNAIKSAFNRLFSWFGF